MNVEEESCVLDKIGLMAERARINHRVNGEHDLAAIARPAIVRGRK